MNELSQQQVFSPQPAQQQPSNISPNNIPSKSKIKFVIAVIIIAILLIGIGGYFMWSRNSQFVSQNSVSKSPQDCGTDFDCFIKASESCSPAIVSRLWTWNYGYEFTATDYFEIKGQELSKCVLYYKTEFLSAKISDYLIKDLLSQGNTHEEIERGKEDALKREMRNFRGSHTCRFNGKDLTLILQEPTVSGYLAKDRDKWSDCTWEESAQESMQNLAPTPTLFPKDIVRANNSQRRSNLNEVLLAILQYTADHNNVVPSMITTSEREISKSGADLCSLLVPAYVSSLPVDPTKSTGAIKGCEESYSTGYTVHLYSSKNTMITVSAPYAEGEIIEVTR